MRFLADENIPIGALLALKQKGFEITSVVDTGVGFKDEEVLRLAREQSFVKVKLSERDINGYS